MSKPANDGGGQGISSQLNLLQNLSIFHLATKLQKGRSKRLTRLGVQHPTTSLWRCVFSSTTHTRVESQLHLIKEYSRSRFHLSFTTSIFVLVVDFVFLLLLLSRSWNSHGLLRSNVLYLHPSDTVVSNVVCRSTDKQQKNIDQNGRRIAAGESDIATSFILI